MSERLKHMDLLYFGYDWADEGPDNRKNQFDFIREIKARFPNVQLQDAYCSIKGFRQEVYLDESESDNYYSWLIGAQWFEMSMVMQMIMMSAGSEPAQAEKFEKYFALAKKQYPETFKPE